MAFIVRRPGGRFEIRESVATAAGPRARTLATFKTLNDAVLQRARARARQDFDVERMRERAARLGIASDDSAAALARRLVGELRRGAQLPPALVRALQRELPKPEAPIPDTVDGADEWLGVDDAVRGRALRDLLDLADHLPQRARPAASVFPRISSAARP